MSDPYRFPGINVFVARDGVRPAFAAKIQSTFLLSRVADALSAIPELRPEHRAGNFAEARDGIAALKATFDTAVAAFDEVMTNCPPTPSDDDPPVPKADPHAATRKPAESGPIPADPEPAPKPASAPAPAGRDRGVPHPKGGK